MAKDMSKLRHLELMNDCSKIVVSLLFGVARSIGEHGIYQSQQLCTACDLGGFLREAVFYFGIDEFRDEGFRMPVADAADTQVERSSQILIPLFSDLQMLTILLSGFIDGRIKSGKDQLSHSRI